MLRWRPRLLCSIPLVGAALMLQGCLAAAIPVLAGSALATKDVIEDGFAGSEKQPDKSVEVARGTPAANVAPANPPKMPTEVISSEGQRVTILDLTELPAPDGTTAGSSADLGRTSFASFAQYAMQAAMPADGESDIPSAMLSNPGALDGKRTACAGKPAAVLIDLDPEGGRLASAGMFRAEPRLAILLDSLRRQDITIGWISGRFADDASVIRTALAQSLLDPLGEDTLLLMRYADDRKQTRRREFAEDYCVLAIAGDHRSDFDELFRYLKNPDQAVALEPIFGNGWFLTPSPLIQE